METTERVEVSATELKTIDPKRFYEEYCKWLSYALDYEWWDFVAEDFRADMRARHLQVDTIEFADIGAPGARAAFNGCIDVWRLMEGIKRDGVPLSELYPALYAACKHDEAYVRVTSSHRCRPEIGFHEQLPYVSPLGVFAALDEHTWQELVIEQWRAADLIVTTEEFVKDMCDELTGRLEAEYEDLTSEETFIQSCEINDITFEIEVETTHEG